jgi:hypothetical protein
VADIDDIRHVLDQEHFPRCKCFEGESEMARSIRDWMYDVSQGHAGNFMAHLESENVCPEALPYFLALFSDICLTISVSLVVKNEREDRVNLENSVFFTEMRGRMMETLKERLDALRKRGDRLAFVSSAEGTSSVQ